MEQAEIAHKACSANFSPNSRYVVTTSHDTTSFDGRYLAFTTNDDDTVKLYGLGDDGQCIEKACITGANRAFFSTDGNHLFTYHRKNFDCNVSLYGLSQDGKLKLKVTIDHGQPVCTASISPTGRHLVTNGIDARAKNRVIVFLSSKRARFSGGGTIDCPAAVTPVPAPPLRASKPRL